MIDLGPIQFVSGWALLRMSRTDRTADEQHDDALHQAEEDRLLERCTRP